MRTLHTINYDMLRTILKQFKYFTQSVLRCMGVHQYKRTTTKQTKTNSMRISKNNIALIQKVYIRKKRQFEDSKMEKKMYPKKGRLLGEEQFAGF